jgi:predicted phosphodiesterase
MRILIISDLHANLTALEAVLAEAGPVDACWCLGDLVGYGPDPNECIARVRGLPNLKCIIGNHDAAVLKQIDVDTFNPEARLAIIWTQKALSDNNVAFLRQLPEKLEIGQVTLAHGSPRHPVWEYLLDTRTATLNFSYFATLYCFVGHTHLPVTYSMTNGQNVAGMAIPLPNTRLVLSPRVILNPGSVGQPRDRDPRASFAIYDPDTNVWEYRRVAYDFRQVQERMLSAGLPERHIQRLSGGW